MSEKAINIVLAVLAALAIAGFVAIGGDGNDLQDHSDWMAQTKEQGAWVVW